MRKGRGRGGEEKGRVGERVEGSLPTRLERAIGGAGESLGRGEQESEVKLPGELLRV